MDIREGSEPLLPSKFTSVVNVWAGAAIAVAANRIKAAPAVFHTLTLVTRKPPWLELRE
jgi:hypothetical protein